MDRQELARTAVQLTPALERLRKRLLDLSANNALLNYKHPKAASLRIVDEVPALVLARMIENGSYVFEPLTEEEIKPPSTSDLFDEAATTESWLRPRRTIEPNRQDLLPSCAQSQGDDLSVLGPRERARAERRASQERRDAKRQRRAAALGINPTYELPQAGKSAQHRDSKLQTMLFPDELEEQLRKIARTATTVLEETGANRLHLIFGFVEWSESQAGAVDRVTRLAPLVLMPVELQRRDVDPVSKTYRYSLQQTGEDWSANVTLQEKCRTDFNFELPVVEGDDETLEHYFQRVEDVIGVAQPTWKLHRYMTLGLVSFGKILMWRDLDSKNWPANRPIFSSSSFRKLFGSEQSTPGGTGSGGGGPVEYPLDQLDEGPGSMPPVVIEADSSQHSVLVDVERGVDLVVQGPPGTGKSQTIANLIAAAMKYGRKVLFVAEKKAALDVVYSRLRGAELGPHCLALHSHSSAKKEFISDLAASLALRDDPPSAPGDLDGITQRLLSARETLGRPLSALHAPFAAVEMTPYEIFWRVRRLESTLHPDVLASVQELRMPQVVYASRQSVEAHRELVEDFAGAFANVRAEGTSLDQHPWAGVTHAEITNTDVDDIIDTAHEWQKALMILDEEAHKVEELIGAPILRTTDALDAFAAGIGALTPVPDGIRADLISALFNSLRVPEVRAAVDAVLEARQRWISVGGAWAVPGGLARSEAESVDAALRGVEGHFAPTDYVSTVREKSDSLRSVLERISLAELAITRLIDVVARETTGHHAEKEENNVALNAAARAVLATVATRTFELDSIALALLSLGTGDTDASARIELLASRAITLRSARAELEARFPRNLRPTIDVLRETATALAIAPRLLPALFSSAYRKAVRNYRTMGGSVDSDRETMIKDVRNLVSNTEALAEFADDSAIEHTFGTHAAGVESPFTAALAAADWHALVREKTRPLGVAARETLAFVSAISASGWRDAAELIDPEENAWQAATQLADTLSEAAVLCPDEGERFSSLPLVEVRATVSVHLMRCETFLRVVDSSNVKGSMTIMALRERFGRVQSAWLAEDRVADCAGVLGGLEITVAGAETNVAPLQEGLAYLGRVQTIGLPQVVESWILSDFTPKRLNPLRACATRISEAVERVRAAAEPLVTMARLVPSEWAGAIANSAVAVGTDGLISVYQAPLSLLLERLNRALSREKALHPWAVYRRSRAKAVGDGLAEIVSLVESERLECENAGDAYEAAFYRNLAKVALRQADVLDSFDSGVHGEVRQRFARLDAEREQKMRGQIVAELARTAPVPGCSGPRVRDMSEESLIRHQAGLQTRHIPIREMFRRAGRAIQAIKPCFLMGPQAVAQYLPPGEFDFDLVVMDEASQLRPEDALGAIARGRQVLIVGDPMQLGPTRFFDRQDEDEDDEVDDDSEQLTDSHEDSSAGESVLLPQQEPTPIQGATVLERSESILIAAATQLPVRMLRWHYRSRHQRLITFSNREFYQERLIIFPSPTDIDADDGVMLQRVNGIYGSQCNPAEAVAVVAAVRQHAKDFPKRSLLVATLNAKQADLIDRLVEEAEKDDPILADFRARHANTQEPFTVKNLENVQGDERDRIMVSVTFGPNEAGQLRQNFGPLNQAGGERRLNVLFTRAKHRLDVFCSFDPNALRVNEASSPRGLRVLRDYLRYASGEIWWAAGTRSGRAPDSDFEVAVATALAARGYEVRAQIGVAGYFIDLAIVNPAAPGSYLLGIECDGATYHSARTARDRDRLRQKQLESLGWSIHRIWSTDWFKDAVGQTNRVVTRLESLLAQQNQKS